MALAPAALTATVWLAATVRFARGLTIAARLATVRAGRLPVAARSLTIAARSLAILTWTIITARGRAIIAARSRAIAARFGAGFAAWHVAKGALFAFLRCERVEHRAARGRGLTAVADPLVADVLIA